MFELSFSGIVVSLQSRPKPWRSGGGGRFGRRFDPNDRCYECGERGHYAYDCRIRLERSAEVVRDRVAEAEGVDPGPGL